MSSQPILGVTVLTHTSTKKMNKRSLFDSNFPCVNEKDHNISNDTHTV